MFNLSQEDLESDSTAHVEYILSRQIFSEIEEQILSDYLKVPSDIYREVKSKTNLLCHKLSNYTGIED